MGHYHDGFCIVGRAPAQSAIGTRRTFASFITRRALDFVVHACRIIAPNHSERAPSGILRLYSFAFGVYASHQKSLESWVASLPLVRVSGVVILPNQETAHSLEW